MTPQDDLRKALEQRAVQFSNRWGAGGNHADMMTAFAAEEIAASAVSPQDRKWDEGEYEGCGIDSWRAFEKWKADQTACPTCGFRVLPARTREPLVIEDDATVICATPADDLRELAEAIGWAHVAYLNAMTEDNRAELARLLWDNKGTFAPALRQTAAALSGNEGGGK